MDPYSSSFFRPDPSSAGAEHVMHCGPVQDNAAAVKLAPEANSLEEVQLKLTLDVTEPDVSFDNNLSAQSLFRQRALLIRFYTLFQH